ncbi:MAG: alternative ribosome rescue aminoacyl-tRNA hydrolase ArfB [Myxococcota bacterium]
MLVVSSRMRIPLRELRFRFSRSSGPGGQNVNKLSTRATLQWNLERSANLPSAVRERFKVRYGTRIRADGVLVLSSQRFRDQGRNVADCLEKLREMLASVERPPRRRKATRPTRSAVERRLREKRHRSRAKRRRRRPGPDED